MLRAGLAFILLCTAASAAAAQAPKSIDPGMSESKVVERLGQPDASRASGDFKYLFYHNSCIKQCGMDDVVILQKDSVIDAMFRAADRTYSGKSSSPRSIPAEVAARTRPGARDVPSSEVVQAGTPVRDSGATHATPDSSAKTAPHPKQPRHKAVLKARAADADSTTHHDTVTGTLRIPVKPPIHSMKADSAHADTTAKRPPHED
jgi:hypothetical protein